MPASLLAAPNGVLLVDKPQAITSHDVVARARRALNTRKIGHAGTLDPMATGLLILGVGPATVRSHLKRILAKTGTHRQAEAAALLARSVATFSDH